MAGRPTTRGMRFPAGDIPEMLAVGMKEPDIVEQHPILEKKDISAALIYATSNINNTTVNNAASP